MDLTEAGLYYSSRKVCHLLQFKGFLYDFKSHIFTLFSALTAERVTSASAQSAVLKQLMLTAVLQQQLLPRLSQLQRPVKWRLSTVLPASRSNPGRTIVSTIEKRIYTEENAMVVAASWGTEFLQFLAALAILHQDDLKNRQFCTRTSQRIGCKSA